MMKINGQKYDYQEKKLLELLEEQGHRPEMVAVELNEETQAFFDKIVVLNGCMDDDRRFVETLFTT